MEVSAKLSSKGQITVPRSVRDALHLVEGDQVVFRVDGERAILAKTPDFLSLAGSVAVPASVRGMPWAEVIGAARRTRSTRVARSR